MIKRGIVIETSIYLGSGLLDVRNPPSMAQSCRGRLMKDVPVSSFMSYIYAQVFVVCQRYLRQRDCEPA